MCIVILLERAAKAGWYQSQFARAHGKGFTMDGDVHLNHHWRPEQSQIIDLLLQDREN